MSNRGENANDEWLTPKHIIDALGSFDLDPCCPFVMPWRTARVMLTNQMKGRVPQGLKERVRPKFGDGLLEDWKGRVWLNEPFSDPLPWIEKMVDHGNGIILAPAKSTDTRWCQLLLNTADSVLFLDDRISFCYPNGVQSKGKWSPYLFAAYGRANVRSLEKLDSDTFPGVHMSRR